MQQSYGEAFAEVVSRSVIPRSTGLGDHGKQLLHTPPPAAAHSLTTYTQKYSTNAKSVRATSPEQICTLLTQDALKQRFNKGKNAL